MRLDDLPDSGNVEDRRSEGGGGGGFGLPIGGGGLGIGLYPRSGFVHIDVRPPPSYRWIDYSPPNSNASEKRPPRGWKRTKLQSSRVARPSAARLCCARHARRVAGPTCSSRFAFLGAASGQVLPAK